VGFHGTGIITYGEALAAVFMEGYASYYPVLIKQLIDFDKVDLLVSILARDPTMAGATDASVIGFGCGNWDRFVYCVSHRHVWI
jgi:hypothetical protein